jgi:hypothetical protein
MEFFKKMINPFNQIKQPVNNFLEEDRANLETNGTTLTTLEIKPKTVEEYNFRITASSLEIGTGADELIDKMPVLDEPMTLELKVITAGELDPDEGTRAGVYKKALELGYELCPAQVGPELLINYPGLPGVEFLQIAMEPIANDSGTQYVFEIHNSSYKQKHNDGKLSTTHGAGSLPVYAHDTFVFCIRK